MSLKRHIETVAYRLLGPKGLGAVSGLLWSRPRFRSKDKPTVLAITHTLFEKDIAEIDREGEFNWVFLVKQGFGGSQKRLLPKELRSQRFYYPSLAEPKYQQNWRDIEQFGLGLIAAIRMRWGIDAVLTAHVDYWQDEGLRRACGQLGIPFLVLCQENYNIPKTYRVRKEDFSRIGFRFGGAAIATFSDHMRDLFANVGVASRDRLVVTGAPRLDGWQRTRNRPEKKIVLLSFFDPGKYHIDADAFFAVVTALREAASLQSGWRLIVKCKNAANANAVAERIGKAADIEVVHETPLPDLLSTASVIVGAGSLSMVEALLSKAELIVPTFVGSSEDPDTMLFNPEDPQVSNCIGFAADVAALKQQVAAAVEKGEPQVDRAGRLALMQRYIHFDDSESSAHRVAGFIRRFIDQSAQTRGRAATPDVKQISKA